METMDALDAMGVFDDVQDDTVAVSSRRRDTFPPELQNFTFADRACLICGIELDPTKVSDNYLEVAQKIEGYVENNFSLDLQKLLSNDIRRLAKQFGLKNLGSKTKFQIRLALAEKKNSIKRFNIDALTSTTITSADNTKNIVRVINGCFHPDYYDTFLTLNDRKGRVEIEVGTGARNANFWNIMADFVNDVNNIELDNFFNIHDNEDYNNYIKKATATGYLPVGCSQLTGDTCKVLIDSVVKVRSTIIANMTKSGMNENDPYIYTTAAIKRQNLVRSVSNFAAYYFCIACSQHPEMDSVLRRYLGKSVKAESTETSWDDSSSKKGKKKDNPALSKLIDVCNGVGVKFESHFEAQKARHKSNAETQKKRFATQKRNDAINQYVDLKMKVLKYPSMREDELIVKLLSELKEIIDSTVPVHPSPLRKKTCSGDNDDDIVIIEEAISASLDDTVPSTLNGSVNSEDSSLSSSRNDYLMRGIPTVIRQRNSAKEEEHTYFET